MKLIRIVLMVVALGAFVTGAVGLATAAPFPPVPTAHNPGAVANRRAAKRDVRVLMAKLVLPAGAVLSASDPGVGKALAEPAFSSATAALVDIHRFWRVTGQDPSSVVTWFQNHVPGGSTLDTTGGVTGPGIQISALGFAFPGVNGVLSSRQLAVSITSARGGGTAIRADAEDVWFLPRPKWERVPSGVTQIAIRVNEFNIPARRPSTITRTVTGARKVARIVSLVNALPPGQPGVTSCPVDFGPDVTMDFQRTASGAPVASAVADGSGCGGVSFKLHGKTEPYLSGGDTLVDQLAKLLDFTVPKGP